MNGLHQQLAGKRADLAANEVKARSTKADPRDASDAKERLPFLRQEIGRLEAETAVGDDALRMIEQGLGLLRRLSAGRELNLGINAAEVAVFRIKNHLGTVPEPSKPAACSAEATKAGEAGAPPKLWIHEGKGHYVGSLVIVAAATKTEAVSLIREELDKCGLKTEPINANEAPISNGKPLLTRSGDY